MKTNKGFTLIELLVVIAIIGVLLAIGIGFTKRSSDPNYDPTIYMDHAEAAFYNEQKRANDIRERELQLQAQQQQK